MGKKIFVSVIILIILVLLTDLVILPWWVNREETKVPNVVGLRENEAIALLEENDLNPILSDTTFNESYPKGTIVLQRPDQGSVVKVGRRIYLFISGGEPTVVVPLLKGKSVRYAKFALERIGLKLGNVDQIPSNSPKNMIFDQEFVEGTPIKKGQTVSISVSSGVETGEIFVPDLIGKSLLEAGKLLADSLLKVGKINYQISFSLLPNTIIDQYPSKDTKLNPGDPVDLFVTKSSDIQIKNEIEEK
ncbi:MAG: PASTA domain-containing protein [Ignavibacteriaceae bacterium]|nr:PASTA domain-containing protein [Ignavibacteriaceae bacterium]